MATLENGSISISVSTGMTPSIDVDDEKPTAALFEHCVKVYNEMTEQARDEEDGLIYEGFLTKLFQGLQLSTPYYTSVMGKLKQMGCVESLRRGGGSTPSRWRILAEPTEESFNSFQKTNKVPHGKHAVLEQQFRDLSKRFAEMETRIEYLEQLLIDNSGPGVEYVS